MSTLQTDAHNNTNISDYENYLTAFSSSFEDAEQWILDNQKVVDPKVLLRCEDHLADNVKAFQQEAGREDLQEQKEERQREYMDMHFAPSEPE